MRFIPSLRIERVELASREHSSSPRRRCLPQLDLCPSSIPRLCQCTMSLSARSHTYCATARATRRLLGAPKVLQRCPSQPASVSSPQDGWRLPHPQHLLPVPLHPSPPPPTPPHLPHATGARTAPQKRCRVYASGAASVPQGTTETTGIARSPRRSCSLGLAPLCGVATRRRLRRRLGQHGDRGRLEHRWASHTGAAGGAGAIAITAITAIATRTSAAAAMHGRRGDAGWVRRGDDLRAQLPATPWHAVHPRSSGRGGGATIGGWAGESKVRAREGLQSLNGSLMGTCRYQVRDGTCWAQGTRHA